MTVLALISTNTLAAIFDHVNSHFFRQFVIGVMTVLNHFINFQ